MDIIPLSVPVCREGQSYDGNVKSREPPRDYGVPFFHGLGVYKHHHIQVWSRLWGQTWGETRRSFVSET